MAEADVAFAPGADDLARGVRAAVPANGSALQCGGRGMAAASVSCVECWQRRVHIAPGVVSGSAGAGSDGIGLATDLYLPDGSGPFPVIAVRTPYAKSEGRLIADFFARYGYAVAVQDVRGRHASEGEFYPFRAEVNDGVDFTRWIKQQPWCDGKIGAFGLSYLGFTQWAMAAANPDLTSISPTLITANLYNGLHQGGAFGKLTFLHWSLTSYGRYGDAAGAWPGRSWLPALPADRVGRRRPQGYLVLQRLGQSSRARRLLAVTECRSSVRRINRAGLDDRGLVRLLPRGSTAQLRDDSAAGTTPGARTDQAPDRSLESRLL